LINTYRNEKTLSYQYLTNSDISNPIDRPKSHVVLKTKISSHNLELDQYPTFNKLASYHLNEIELEHKCEPDLQFYDSVPNFESMLTLVFLPYLNHIPKPTFVPLLINFKHEPSILKSHISLMGKECETQFFDLDPTLKSNLTVEPKLDLHQLPESVLVPLPFTFEPKSTMSRTTFHCWTNV